MSNRRVRLGLVLVAILGALALLAPALAPYDPTKQIDLLGLRNAAPSLQHLLGTDLYSRDVLSRALYGARVSLLVALLSVLLSLSVGTAVGLAAGFTGGAVDGVLMRAVDAALAIPRVFLLLVVMALWPGVGVLPLVLILGFTSWFGTSRLVRAEVLSVRSREYIAAGRALGLSATRVALRHVLPNVAAPILVTGTLSVGNMILVEAGLSYLGLGVPQPTPSLGSMISEGQPLLAQAPWIATVPGIAIVFTVLAFSVLSDGLREVLDRSGA